MTSSVRKESNAVAGMAQHWPMIRSLLGGTSAMRAAGLSYLPKWPNEEADSYKTRLSVATLYPAFSRTVEVMAGKPFSKALTASEDCPERIREWCDDIDLQGRNLHAFAADLLRDCIGYGISGVLVDFPKSEGVRTKADELASGARPYFTRYAPGNVLGWRTESRAGADRLIQLRLLESVEEQDGEFGEKVVEQVRVLTPGAWETYRKNAKDEWFPFDSGTTTLSSIPFVFFYGERQSFGVGKPPLLELAHQNVEHWQSASDQQTIVHVARVPILTIIGADDGTSITVGASSAVKLPVGADMKFVEHSGAAIEAGRVAIQDLEERMRQTGAELLVTKPGKVTATQTVSENEANKCALQRMAEAFDDALDQALQFMADWVGEATGGSVELFKDYGAGSLSDASAELLLKTNLAGKISDESYHNELKRRGIVAPESNWEDEKERLDSQGPSLGMMGESDPVTNDPEPITQTLESTPAEPADYTEILDAIKAIPTPEQPQQADTAPIMSAIEQLAAKVEEISQKVDEPQEAEIDLTPIQQSIAALSAKIEAIESADPDTEISEQIKALAAQVAVLSAKPDPQAPDLTAIMREVNQAIANIPKQAQPVMIIDPQTGAVKKQITLQYGEDGKPNGATVEQVNIQGVTQ